MFAKGPMPGATPKADALKVWPNAKCYKREACGIRGYVVLDRDGTALASAGTAMEAWRKTAARRLERKP